LPAEFAGLKGSECHGSKGLRWLMSLASHHQT
jgi:hypothetical protein